VKGGIEPLLSQLLVLLEDLRIFEEHKPVNFFVRRKFRILFIPDKNSLLPADLLSLFAKALVVFRIPDSQYFARGTGIRQGKGRFKRMETVLILIFSRGCDKSRGNRTSGV